MRALRRFWNRVTGLDLAVQRASELAYLRGLHTGLQIQVDVLVERALVALEDELENEEDEERKDGEPCRRLH